MPNFITNGSLIHSINHITNFPKMLQYCFTFFASLLVLISFHDSATINAIIQGSQNLA